MPKQFVGGATGTTTNLERRIAIQPLKDEPPSSGFVGFLSMGGSFGINYGSIPRAVIGSGGAPRAPLPGKNTVTDAPLFFGDSDGANLGQLHCLANLFGHYDVTDNTTYYDWVFGLDGGTDAALYLTSQEDTDIIPRGTFYNWRVDGLEVSAGPNDNYAIQFGRSVPNYHNWGLPVQTVGSGSTLPTVLGSVALDHYEVDGTDADMYIAVGVPVALPDLTVDAKKTLAASYFSNDQPYVLGDSGVRLLDETGDFYGALFADQPRVFWASGSTLVALDEFQIPNRLAAWTPDPVIEFPISSVNTRWFLDGEELNAEGGYSITAGWDGTGLVPDTTGAQGGAADRTGFFNATVNPTRQILDITIQEMLATGKQLSCVIEGVSDAVISGTVHHEFTHVFPSVRVTGEGYGVNEGGTNREESPVLVAGVPAAPFSYKGKSFASHYHVWIRNNFATLTG